MTFPALGRHSPRLKALRHLQDPSGREAAGAFLLEGPRVLEEALAARLPLDLLLLSDRGPQALAAEAARRGVEVRTVEAATLERVSPARTSQGVLAVARLPRHSPGEALAGDLALVLEGIQDPGNVGTLLRSAWGAGARGALLVGGADPFGPRAVRSAAGAAFRLPAPRVAREEALRALAASGHAVVAAVAHGGSPLFDAALPRRMALVLGGEVGGVSEVFLEAAAHRVTVPLAAGCESLNVAAAGALALFEHRRRFGPPEGG